MSAPINLVFNFNAAWCGLSVALVFRIAVESLIRF